MAAQRGGSGDDMDHATACDGGRVRRDISGDQPRSARSRCIKIRTRSKARLLAEVARRWFCGHTLIGRVLCGRGLVRRKTEPVASLRCLCACDGNDRCDIGPPSAQAGAVDLESLARSARRLREQEHDEAERSAFAISGFLMLILWMSLAFAWLCQQQGQAGQHKPAPPAVVREDDEPSAAIVSPLAFHFARF